MRLSRQYSQIVIVVSVGVVSFLNCLELVTGVPQWVWNPEANTAPGSQQSGGGSGRDKVIFSGEGTAAQDKDKVPVEIVETQARLFPSIISAISNTLAGNRPSSGGSSSSSTGSSESNNYPDDGSSNGVSNGGTSASCNGVECKTKCKNGGTLGACTGSALASQAIEAVSNAGSAVAGYPSAFGNFFQNIFGSNANTLPAQYPGNGGGNNIIEGGNREPATGSCSCMEASLCFLPYKPYGSCDGGTRSRVRCCPATRGTRVSFFPDEDNRLSPVRSVTRSQIRRQLFRNIIRGSGDVIDDTLDLLLHPFLTKEDQVKVATRLLVEN